MTEFNEYKHLCVFGVLKTAEGLKIKEEMLEWLNPLYNVLCIEQDPPGRLFEYPAIKYALQLSIDMDEPVLYIHTKGAANKNTWYQKGVRKVWKQEFGDSEKTSKIFEMSSLYEKPLVICPFAGKSTSTWFNGFVVNPLAAKSALPNLLAPPKCGRFYYETRVFSNEVKILGTLDNNCNDNSLTPYIKKILHS